MSYKPGKHNKEELNMINGGNAAKGMLVGAKFNVGDKVISKSAPDGGVGTVEKSKYDKGWWYSVRMQGGLLYISPVILCYNLGNYSEQHIYI